MIPHELRVGRHEADTDQDRDAVIACAIATFGDSAHIDHDAKQDLIHATMSLIVKRRRHDAAKKEPAK